MQRWACADIPCLALQLVMRAHPDWRGYPVAVVDKDTARGVILQVNRAARDYEIKPGIRYAAGLSLHRDLRAAVVSQRELDEACKGIVDALREFSPHVESDAQAGLFWLRATGMDRLFGGFETWASQLLSHLDESLALLSSITVGWTRFGTFVASRAEPVGWRIFASEAEEVGFRDSVRLDILGLPVEATNKLEKLAITRLSQFLQLPPSGVRKRYGPETAELWMLAHGERQLPLQPIAWEKPVQRIVEMSAAVVDTTQLTFILKHELHPLLLELAARFSDLQELLISLKLEDGDDVELSVRPANPTLDEVRIVELCRLRLDRLTLVAPVIRVELLAIGVLSHRDQNHLFHDNARRDLQVANHALARLQAEYPDAVFRVVARERHLPESRFTLEPFDSMERAEPSQVQRKSVIRRIFDRPVPLPRFDSDPGFGWLVRDLEEGVVMKAMGPHRISGGWWLDGKAAVAHIIDRRFADTSTHHVSPRARYFARDAPFVEPPPEDDADVSMRAVAPHRGEFPKSPRRLGKPRSVANPGPTARPTSTGFEVSSGPGVARDYWFLQTDRGDVFWTYYDARRQQWFMHGVVE